MFRVLLFPLFDDMIGDMKILSERMQPFRSLNGYRTDHYEEVHDMAKELPLTQMTTASG